MAWVFLATAPDPITADLWIAILREEGIAAMVRPSDAVSYLGVAGFGCRVQVPEELLDRAKEVLGDVGSEPR